MEDATIKKICDSTMRTPAELNDALGLVHYTFAHLRQEYGEYLPYSRPCPFDSVIAEITEASLAVEQYMDDKRDIKERGVE